MSQHYGGHGVFRRVGQPYQPTAGGVQTTIQNEELWCAEAYNIKDRRGRRAQFADLVSYIDRQAKIAMDPLFGNILDTLLQTESHWSEKPLSHLNGSMLEQQKILPINPAGPWRPIMWCKGEPGLMDHFSCWTMNVIGRNNLFKERKPSRWSGGQEHSYRPHN